MRWNVGRRHPVMLCFIGAAVCCCVLEAFRNMAAFMQQRQHLHYRTPRISVCTAVAVTRQTRSAQFVSHTMREGGNQLIRSVNKILFKLIGEGKGRLD